MLLDHIKMSFRSILKNRLYSAINMIGLSVGFAVCVLIVLFVKHETSFDRSVPDSEHIYRLNWENVKTGARFATFFNALSPKIAEAYPEDVQDVTRLALSENLLTISDKKNFETVSFVDANFFEMFPYAAVQGDALTALADINSAVLTKAASDKLFGETDPIGKTFTLDGEYDFQVKAIVENSPNNSHLVSYIFLNMEMLPTVWGRSNMWESNFSDQLYHYMKLAPGVETSVFQEKMMDYLVANVHKDARAFITVPLQPMRDIHFTPDLQNEMMVKDLATGVSKPLRQRSDVTIFGLVALLTLIIATFNFMNMQIAQSSRRIKEVGVRKVLGASRFNIAFQFIVESMIMSMIALLGAITLVEMLTPSFGAMLGVPLIAADLYEIPLLSGLLTTTVLIGLVSGLYPALFVAGLVPTKALHGEMLQGIGSAKIRAGLVVAQFAISIALMSASGIVNNQIDYALNKPIGYDSTNVVKVGLGNREARAAYKTMREELLASPLVSSVSAGTVIPTMDLSDGFGFQKEDAGPDFSLSTRGVMVSHDYFSTLGMKLVAGRALSDEFESDKMPPFSPENSHVITNILLNERAVKRAGWASPEEAVGEKLFSAFTRGGTDYRFDYTIVGVVEDAHFGSLRSEVVPLSYMMADSRRAMVIKLASTNTGQATQLIDSVWKNHVPSFPIIRSYLEDDYAAYYAVEGRTFGVFVGFAGIAVLIACMGLYGLASFIADRREREVGIRKVLGASVFDIVMLLSWELSKLVLLANVIAWPAAWILMNDWLTNFVYRIDMTLVPFVSAGVIALLLAFITISSRAISTARLNPILALKHE